jgi:4-amino-4-deoxy-L-arabinose transferase-like glycosyltransferase
MTFTEIMEIVRAISLIAVLVFSIALAAYALIKASREKGFTRRRLAQVILALGALFITYLAYNVHEIAPADWAQIMLTLGLVAVTGFYALSASRQADASVKMAEEMKEQRIIASRPFVIQRINQTKSAGETPTAHLFYFEIYNTGNGPAIELEISFLNEEKLLTYSTRQNYLLTGESVKIFPEEYWKEQLLSDTEYTVRVVPIHFVARKKRAYLVSEYQNIFSDRKDPTWYQTWLPFRVDKIGKKEELQLVLGELDFREVHDKDRINAFAYAKPK